MNPLIETASAEQKFRKQIEDGKKEAVDKLRTYDEIELTLISLGAQLSEAANCYTYSKNVFLTVDNREDLQKCLSIGQLWKKSNSSTEIHYSWTDPNGYIWTIHAKDAALPATCKVVTEEVLIPARPAYYEKREKITCILRPGITSASEESRPTPDLVEPNSDF